LSKNSELQIANDSQLITSHSLKHLDISGCNASSVSFETFAELPALEWLDLRHNNLSSVDEFILILLPKLSVLYLHDNPLQCDHHLQAVLHQCQYLNIETFYEGKAPECVTLSEVNGLTLGDLEENQTLQDNIGDVLDFDFEFNQILNQIIKRFEEYVYFIRHVQLPVLSVLSKFGITGNVILIIIITCDKDMRNIPNMYILNLAISDLILLTQTFLFATLIFLIHNRNKSHYILLDFFKFCSEMAFSLTAYSVAVLSFQRYSVTANPLQARVSSQTSRRATVATICVMWILAALLTVPPFIIRNTYKSNTSSEFVTYFRFASLFELLFSCVLPLCVITFSYCLTYRHLMKNSFSLIRMAQIHQIKRRRNAAKVVLGLAIVFAISYMPSYFLSTFFSFYDKTIERDYVQYFYFLHVKDICTFFLCLNSCLNPVAVFYTSLAFRMRLKRYLTRCCTNKFPSY